MRRAGIFTLGGGSFTNPTPNCPLEVCDGYDPQEPGVEDRDGAQREAAHPGRSHRSGARGGRHVSGGSPVLRAIPVAHQSGFGTESRRVSAGAIRGRDARASVGDGDSRAPGRSGRTSCSRFLGSPLAAVVYAAPRVEGLSDDPTAGRDRQTYQSASRGDESSEFPSGHKRTRTDRRLPIARPTRRPTGRNVMGNELERCSRDMR